MGKWRTLDLENGDMSIYTGGAERSDFGMFRQWAADHGIFYWRLISLPLKWTVFNRCGRIESDFGVPLCYPDEKLGRWVDHVRAYRDRRRKVYIISQPYADPDELRPKLESWAERRGLRVDVRGKDESWYYPGETCLIIITAGEAAANIKSG